MLNGTDGYEKFTYIGTDDTARIEATGRDHSASGFDVVLAHAGEDTGDMAHFIDIPAGDPSGDDVFYFRPHKTQLVGQKAKVIARLFDEVRATAGGIGSGFNVARIYDPAGDEHLEVVGDAARWYRRNGLVRDLIREALALTG